MAGSLVAICFSSAILAWFMEHHLLLITVNSLSGQVLGTPIVRLRNLRVDDWLLFSCVRSLQS